LIDVLYEAFMAVLLGLRVAWGYFTPFVWEIHRRFQDATMFSMLRLLLLLLFWEEIIAIHIKCRNTNNLISSQNNNNNNNLNIENIVAS